MTNAIDRINDLRQRVRLGDPLSKEELKEAIELLRGDRKEKMDKSTGGKTVGVPLDLNDLFKEDNKGN